MQASHKNSIGMVEVHAFPICSVFFYGMNIEKVSLKEWILRTKFWANTYMTKMLLKFPPYIEKKFKWYYKNWFLKNFKLYIV